jgi:hypothetical protein
MVPERWGRLVEAGVSEQVPEVIRAGIAGRGYVT